MTDYSTFTDKQIDAEIAGRLGIIDEGIVWIESLP